MPIPYLGSKRKSAGKIYQTIKNLNPFSNSIVDLFCGGFAISEYFIKNGWNVQANDKNKYVIALLDQVINKRLDEKKCLEFVSRAIFYDVINNSYKYEDWYVGYVQCIWSFGNQQENYIFSKDIEKYKKAGHELVINCNPNLLLGLFPNFNNKFINGIIKQKDWHLRRIALLKVIRVLKNKQQLQQLERLERLQQLERLERLQQLERLGRLEQLEQLERLEQLEQLEQHIKLTNLSYDEVLITNNAVIYCDPPYKGTAEYREKNFDYKKFWDWAREKSKTHKVYISEYQAPDDFESILEFEQKSTLQGGVQKHNNQPKEKLFRIKKIKYEK